jgi:hypothetical protein
MNVRYDESTKLSRPIPPDRSPEDLLGSEPFDEDHGPTAVWTEPCSRSTGGGSAKTKSAYERFLTLWKDAYPDIPILKQTKAEYAKLQ